MSLTKVQREVLVRRLRGETYQAIAKDKGVSYLRVQQIYDRAKIELLKQLGQGSEIGQ